MKIKIYKILSFFSIIIFSLYWSVAFLWTLPAFKSKNSIGRKINLPKTIFMSEWKLFTPPATYDYRLYYIVRNIKKTAIADRIEVLENLSIQQQLKAPFNQQELILDYLVNKNIARLSKTGWAIDKKSGIDSSGIATFGKIPSSMAKVESRKNYQMNFSSLFNFGMMVLHERNINIEGNEMKIVIKKKIIKPFKEMHNKRFVRTETTTFESPYMSLQ